VLTVAAPGYWSNISSGASVAIDGVCLTLTHSDEKSASFDVIAETLRCTTIGELQPGDRVNLQKSLRVGDTVDGHFVQGHVDGTGTIDKIETSERENIYWFAGAPNVMEYIIPKGSIAIDGISLTIVTVALPRFSVALIPTTLERTTLGTKTQGRRVNIETDILARTIVYRMRDMGSAKA
jgi:riboflavin synthase